MAQETTSINNDGDGDAVDSSQTGYFPSPGTHLATRTLESTDRSQLVAELTPIRQSLLSASVGSSASSTSTVSTTFDNDSSLTGTPLTPPLAGEPILKDSLRSVKDSPGSVFKLSPKEQNSQKSSTNNAIPFSIAPPPTSVAQSSGSPLTQEQSGDQSVSRSENDISLELDSLKNSESPVTQMQNRKKRVHAPTDIDGIAEPIQSLGGSKSHKGPIRRNSNIHGEGGGNRLETPQLDVNLSSTSTDDIDVFHDNNQYLRLFSANMDEISGEIVGDDPNLATPVTPTSSKIYRAITPEIDNELVDIPRKTRRKPRSIKQSETSPTSHLRNLATSTSQEPDQVKEGSSTLPTPEPASFSKRRRSKSPGKSSDVPQDIKDVKPSVADAIAESSPQLIPSHTSKPPVQDQMYDAAPTIEEGTLPSEPPSILRVPPSASLSKSRNRKPMDLSILSSELRATAALPATSEVGSEPARNTRSKTSAFAKNSSTGNSTHAKSIDSMGVNGRDETEEIPAIAQEEMLPATSEVGSEPARNTRSKTSVPVKNSSTSNFTPAKPMDSRRVNGRDEIGEIPAIAQEEMPADNLLFYNFYDKELTGQNIRNEILTILRRKAWEKELNKSKKSLMIFYMQLITPTWISQSVTKIPHLPKEWLSKIPTQQAEKGYIYIFESSADPGYYKIGETKLESAEERIKEWNKDCKREIPYRQVVDSKERNFQFYRVVERLVHAELSNERRKFSCTSCGKNNKDGEWQPREHIEWFETTKEHALEVVEKWRSWVIEQRPYRQDGVLHHVWKWKHDQEMAKANGGQVDWGEWHHLDFLDLVRYIIHDFHLWVGIFVISIMAIVAIPFFGGAIAATIYFVGHEVVIIRGLEFLGILFCCRLLWFVYL